MTAADRDDQLRRLEQELGVLVRRIRRVIGERAQAVHEDLQPASYLILARLAQSEPQRASELVDALGIDKGAVSRQLTHLAELGLVDRMPDPDDGRATLVTASDEARRRLADVSEHRLKFIGERLGEWTDTELEGLIAGLTRYNTALS